MPSQNPNYRRSKIYQKQPLGQTNSGGEYERPTFSQESSGFCGCCRKSQPTRNPPQENRNAQARRSAFRTKSQTRNPQTQSRGNINADDDDGEDEDDDEENDEDEMDTDENDRRKQSSGARSTNSRQPRSSIKNLPNQDQNQNPSHAGNCCRRCLKCIYQHGSLIGPAAFSFSCCCICCLRSIPRAKFSSYGTKIIYLVFLAIVTLFASFFVINYDDDFFEKDGKGMAGFAPCVDGKKPRYIGGWFEDCTGHSGYFMVYRIFLAAIIIFVFLGIFLLGVSSNRDSCRPGVHQGYWCCKLILFFVLVIVFLTQINVGKEGLFDEIWMYFGLVASLIFALPQIVILMDLVEFIYIRIRESCPKRFDFVYWPLTIFIYLIDIGFLVLLGFYYTKRTTQGMGDPLDFGNGALCGSNIALMFYTCIVGVVTFAVTIVHGFIKNSFYPNASLIHSAVVWFHTLLYTYEAMGNSPDIECRPVWFPYSESRNSRDVCFTLEGCVHTFSVWFLLIYLAIGDAPKTKAPLSRAAMKICCIAAPENILDDDEYPEENNNNNKNELTPKTTSTIVNQQQQLSQVVVVRPEEDDDDNEIIPKYVRPNSRAGGGDKVKDDREDAEAINEVPSSTAPRPSSRQRPSSSSSRRQKKQSLALTESEIELRRQRGRFYVQNDEARKLKYSWSLFHCLLILGALSIMMGMTNFIHPRADGPHASSYPAFWFKILISPVGVAGYIIPIIISWSCYQTPSSTTNNNNDDDDTENDIESTTEPEPDSVEASQKSIINTKDEVSIQESTVEIETSSKVTHGAINTNTNTTTTSKNATNANPNPNTSTNDNSNKNKQNPSNAKNKITTTTTDSDNKKVYLIPNKKVGSTDGSGQSNQGAIQAKGNEENNKTKIKRMQSGVVVLQPAPKELGAVDFNKF